MSTTAIPNTHPQRKQLSDQIDRLDRILDGLSEGLNEAIATAAREGTRLALKDAIVELLTDPALRAKLHQATAPEAESAPTKQPGFWAWLKAEVAKAAQAAGQLATRAAQRTAQMAQALVTQAAGGMRVLHRFRGLLKLATLGVGVGLAVGAASFLAPHSVAVAVSGISSAVATAAVQLGLWTRRTIRALPQP